jgi:Mlc titration factor MtfA (ptsG expression regulator)
LKPGNHTIGITNTPYRCTAYAAKQALKLVKQNHQLIGQKIPLYIGRSIYKSLEDVMEDVLQAKEKFPNHDMTIGVTHRVTIAAIAKVLAEEENTDPSAIPHLQQVGAANNRNK